MKYIVPAIILIVLLVCFSKSMYFRSAPVQTESQYPTAELLIAQGAPQKTFLSDALQSSLGQ